MGGIDIDEMRNSGIRAVGRPSMMGVSSVRHLVGFTTLQARVDVFRMCRPAERQDIPGAFVFTGKAKRVLRGEFYGWVVESGDCRDLPDFWPL